MLSLYRSMADLELSFVEREGYFWDKFHVFFLCSEPSYTFERTGIYGFAQGEKVLPFFISQLKSKERAPISS